MFLSKDILEKLYIFKKLSVFEIAGRFKCSEHKINYWIKKYEIKKRTISEAIYLKHNPNGDPFKIKDQLNQEELKLFGLGLGLYWGEGHKRNKHSIRLGNSDFNLTRKFIEFLVVIYGVNKNDITFNLLIFNDISVKKAKNFWIEKLNINPEQIRGKVTIVNLKRRGTYKNKSENGVIILQYHNKKLRDVLCGQIDFLRTCD